MGPTDPSQETGTTGEGSMLPEESMECESAQQYLDDQETEYQHLIEMEERVAEEREERAQCY